MAEKNKIKQQQYYREHREQILAGKRKPASYKLPIVYQCEYECESCPYEDCKLTLYTNHKEYMAMYCSVFHDKLLKKKAEYRASHRAYLANSEKLRNYKKKGHVVKECVFINTDNSRYHMLEQCEGFLVIIKINGNPYLSFISENREHSFRCKLDVLSDAQTGTTDEIIKYKDTDGKQYVFTVGTIQKTKENGRQA